MKASSHMDLGSVYFDDIGNILNILGDCSENVFLKVGFKIPELKYLQFADKLVEFSSLDELKTFKGKPIAEIEIVAYLPIESRGPRRIRIRLFNWFAFISISIPKDAQLLGLQTMVVEYIRRRKSFMLFYHYGFWLILVILGGTMVFMYSIGDPRADILFQGYLWLSQFALFQSIYTYWQRRNPYIRWEYSHFSYSWLGKHRDELIIAIASALIVYVITNSLNLLNLSDLLRQLLRE